uniref:Uncharacterized protein n=1 Tax=Kalanchoe fedtschenkoi TaxID=63787 RepID=A0A7N0RGC2_KALFE
MTSVKSYDVRRRSKKQRVAVLKFSSPPRRPTPPSPAVVLQRRLRELQRVVPGSSHDMGALFRRTADYISMLETKVAALRELSSTLGL